MKEPVYRYRITDYDRSIVPSRFVAFLDDGVIDNLDWVSRSGRSLGHPGWGWVYHTILMLLDADRPNVMVETGTNVGSTAILIGQAILDSGREGVLHTIELDPQIHEEAKRRFDLAGVSSVIKAYCGDALQVLPEVVAGIDEIAVAFLDGNHFHDHVVEEFSVVVDRMRPDGAVIFDNTGLIGEGKEDPRVNGALRTIVSKHGGSLVNLPFCSWYTPGIAIWQRQPFEDMEPPLPGSFTPNS
ncbi:MAG TPA: class I SAM-dependent methyltransferase [Acidimicrobiia bacterium]